MHGQWEGGKGSATRQGFNAVRYRESYDRLYGGQKPVYPTTFEIEFRKFPKIHRLFRDIIITEKIDGTNAQVLVTESEQVFAGSKKRWLTPENDNFEFAAWVQEHADELRQLGPGRHFGEWWGYKIQRGYGLDERRFSLFNVGRWWSKNTGYREPWFDGEEKRIAVPRCCHVVPILHVGSFDIDYIKAMLMALRHNGSTAAPGFMNPEGIVVFHTQSGHLYKTTYENDEKGKSNG